MKNFLIFFMVGFLFLGCTDRNDENNFSLEQKGDFAFARRQYLTAANFWQRAHAKNPKQVPLINKLGDCYLKLGRLERAKIFFKNAVEINPDNIDIQIKLAQVYILTGALSEADKICELFERRKISHPELDLIKADISLMTDQIDKAESFYRRAVIGSKDSLRTLMKLAIFLKSINRHEEAVEILRIVKKNTMMSYRIHLLLADYYLLDNQIDQAERSILDAMRMEPEDTILKYHLIQFYIATQNYSKAEILLKNILKNQDDVYLKMMLSDVYILNGKREKAEKIIIELKKEIKESTVEFELLQGKFWLYSGKPVYATSHLEAALELKPGLVNTRYFLGLTHLINGKNKLAENSLTRTLQIYPDHYDALLLISELLYKRKEYDLSLSYLKRLSEDYPEDFTGHIIKGLNLLGQKNYSLAKKEFYKFMQLGGKPYISHYYSGLTEELMDHAAPAVSYYKRVLEIYPDLMDVSYRYCMLLLKMKQNKIAEDFINKRLTTGKKSPEIYYLAAKIAFAGGHIFKGEALLKKAIQFGNVPGFIYMELASFYQKNHKQTKSIEILKQCILKKSHFQDAWFALSKCYVDRQDLSTAIEIMRKGYEKFQDSPIFQSNLAWLLLEDNQQLDEALSLAQSAYEKMPECLASIDTLGWAYYHKGIYSQAAWLLSEAEKKGPRNGFVQYHLGMTYFQKGEIDKSVKHLKIARLSEASKFFFHEIDTVFSKLSKTDQEKSEIKISMDKESIFSPPENEDMDKNMIIPQWKQ